MARMVHNAHPNELRRKLLKLVEADVNRVELARQYNVGKTFLYRLWRQKCETGSVDLDPQSRTGPPCGVSDKLKRQTLRRLEQHPEMCVGDVRRYWESKGVRLSRSRVGQILCNLGWNMAWKRAQLQKVYGTSSVDKVWRMLGHPERVRKPPKRQGGAHLRPVVPKDPVLSARGRNGGFASQAKRTPEEKSEIGRRAALKRWSAFQTQRP